VELDEIVTLKRLQASSAACAADAGEALSGPYAAAAMLGERSSAITGSATATGVAAREYAGHLEAVWERRLRGVQHRQDVWHRILSVRALVPQGGRLSESWLKYAGLCRASGESALGFRMLLALGMDGSGGSMLSIEQYLSGGMSIHFHYASTIPNPNAKGSRGDDGLDEGGPEAGIASGNNGRQG